MNVLGLTPKTSFMRWRWSETCSLNSVLRGSEKKEAVE